MNIEKQILFFHSIENETDKKIVRQIIQKNTGISSDAFRKISNQFKNKYSISHQNIFNIPPRRHSSRITQTRNQASNAYVNVSTNTELDFQKVINDLKRQNQKLFDENQILFNDSKKKINPIEYILACLTEGLTYAQSARFLCKLNIIPISERTFYRKQKEGIAEILAQAVDESIEKARSKISSSLGISFDTSWSHRRLASQAFGSFVDSITGLIIDYSIVFRENHWMNGNYNGTGKGMEAELFSRMVLNWENDPRWKKLIQDNDSKIWSIAKEKHLSIDRYLDLNHVMKNFNKALHKYNVKHCYIFDDIIISVSKWMRTLLLDDKQTPEEKKENWMNAIHHFTGNHQQCNHGECEEKIWKHANDKDAKALLLYFLDEQSDWFNLVDSKYNTQKNESINAIKAKYANKATSFKTSFKLRMLLAVLHSNETIDYYFSLREKFGLEPLCEENRQVIKKYQKKYVEQNEKAKQTDIKKTRFKRRQKAKKKLTGVNLPTDYRYKEIKHRKTKSYPPPVEFESNFLSIMNDDSDENDMAWVPKENESCYDSSYNTDSERNIVCDDDGDSIDENTYDPNIMHSIPRYGNTCYISAGLQVIFHSKTFMNLILSNKTEIFGKILYRLYQEFKDDIIDLKYFSIYIQHRYIDFRNHNQCDSTEFMQIIYDKILGEKPNSQDYRHNIEFKDYMKRICNSCGQYYEDTSYFLFLEFQALSNVSFEQMVIYSLNLAADKNQFVSECIFCESESQITENHEIVLPSSELLIHFQRYDEFYRLQKDGVIFSDHLKLKNSNETSIWRLSGIISHAGPNNNGHYTTILVSEESMIFECDDDEVKFLKSFPGYIYNNWCVLKYEKIE